MKSIVWMTREFLWMLSQYAVDNPTFRVNRRFSTISWSRRIAKPQQSAARYMDFAGYIGKRFCKSTGFFFITSSRRIQSLDFWRNGRHITACNEWTSDCRHSFESQITVRTVSGKFIRPSGEKILKKLWSRSTKIAELGTSLWQIPYTNNICLLEVKNQKLRYVFVHNFLRKLCCRSKKWSWLIQWMI